MVGQTSDKLCGRQEQPFVNRVGMFEYDYVVPYSDIREETYVYTSAL